LAFVPGFNPNEAQLLLTLSNLTYEDETPLPGESVEAQTGRMRMHINAALAAPPSYGDWAVTWGPALSDDRSNMMYVAESASLNQCAIAIRGTNWAYIEDWLQDFGALLGLTDFRYVMTGAAGANDGVQVALGTQVGLESLISLQAANAAGEQSDLETFLQGKVAAGADVFVTGHSLGGCLASVVAPWLASVQGSTTHLKVYTFAAPSAGNAAFAAYFNNLFVDEAGRSRAFRIYNSLDAVPNAWASLSTVGTYYEPGPNCTRELKLLLAAAQLRLANQYVQVGHASDSAMKLEGSVLGPAPEAFLSLDADQAFLNQVNLQHSPSTYQTLLGS
jgi:hypothetical protein